MPCLNHPDVLTGLNSCGRCGKEFCGNCVITLRGQPICAACKNESVQDIKSGVENDQLDLAGRGARLGAVMLDGLALAVVILPLAFLFGFFAIEPGKAGNQLQGLQLMMTLLMSGTTMIYNGIMLQMRGQTLGKMAAGVKVVHADGSDLTPGQAWKREISRALLSLLPLVSLIDILMIFSKNRATLHDKIGKTRVVKLAR